MFKYLKYIPIVFLFLVTSCSSINKPTPYHTGSDDSNTVNPLPSNNSSFFTNNSNFLANEDANRYREQGFLNSVSTVGTPSACLGSTGPGLTMTPQQCIAYNAGYRSTELGSITFPNTSTCWVAMDENTSGNNAGLPNFTRATGTHYLIDCVDVSQPVMAFDSQILMKVVTSGGSVTGVTDLRSKNTPILTTSIGGSNSLGFGSLGVGTATCPNTVSTCNITLTSSAVTLSAAVPTNSSAILVWQVTQDATGGRVVTWDVTKFRFDNPSGTHIPPVNNTFPNQTEQFTFIWNSALNIWDYQARSSIQQWPMTNQGNSDAIGCTNGNSNSGTPCLLTANIWNQVTSDNGGFLPSGGGGGVALYAYLSLSEVTLCNFNTTTEFYSDYCQVNGTFRRANVDNEIDGNQCVRIPFLQELSGISSSLFSSYHCFIDPTNAMTVLHSNELTEEKPQD